MRLRKGVIGGELGASGLFFALAFLGVFIVQANTLLRASFLVWDDLPTLYQLQEVGLKGLTAPGSNIWFRPVTNFFILALSLAAWNPVLFGMAQLLLLSLTTYMLVRLATVTQEHLGIDRRSALTVALFAGLLFLANPSTKEAVFWVVACMNYTLALLFGLTGTYILVMAQVRWGYSLKNVPLGILCYLVAFGCREVAVVFPFLFVAILFVLRVDWRTRVVAAASAAVLLLAFLGLRATFVANPSKLTPNGSWLTIRGNLEAGLNNSTLPFGKWLNVVDDRLPMSIVLLLTGVGVALLGVGWGTSLHVSNRAAKVINLVLVGAFVAMGVWSAFVLSTTWFDAALLTSVFLLVVGGLWRYADLPNRRVPIFAATLVLCALVFWFGNEPAHWPVLLIVVFISSASACPKGLVPDRSFIAPRLVLALASFACMLVVLAPGVLFAAHQEVSGLNARYAYEASAFGAIGVSCLLFELLERRLLAFRAAWIVLTSISLWLLAGTSSEWKGHYDLARRSVDDLRTIVQQFKPRRIYLLSAPSPPLNDHAAALDTSLFQGKVDIVQAFVDIGALPNDRVSVQPLGANTYVVTFDESGGPIQRFAPRWFARSVQAGREECFDIHYQRVTLKDFRAGRDIVAVADSRGVRVVQR